MKKIPPHISLEEMDEKQLQDALMIGWNEFKAGKTVSAEEAFTKFNKDHKISSGPPGDLGTDSPYGESLRIDSVYANARGLLTNPAPFGYNFLRTTGNLITKNV